MKYTITFLPENKIVEVDSLQSENILDIALDSGIGIDHACGGVCACSTCHIVVEQGLDTLPESTEAEEDQLEKAPGLTTRSRLACQCIPDGSKPVVVRIPSWNRNLVRG